jgi:alkanesulfonate monooxygenase SsuD/methylene tetrahydromethanopterin reductase-like flavin-dependent oxidoreductase (luciferase family)/predicted kinase
VVLVGPAGSGKSHFAAAHFRRHEVVSSDELRSVVGSGEHDLGATEEAFELLERIVAGRLSRRLTTVVDTLGLDPVKRRGWLQAARLAGLPAVVVVIDTPAEDTRRRNADRAYVVPAPALTQQLRRFKEVRGELDDEGWDLVHVVTPDPAVAAPPPVAVVEPPSDERRSSQGLAVMLQVARFPWGEDPAGWLRSMALAADEAGFAGLALMDHLIQIPQVDRAWEPIAEPWVSLGLVAGLDTGLRLGTLVTPVTFRPAGVTAKAAATLDTLTGGRAFVGVGAGWWDREHAAYGLSFPPARQRLDELERAIETMRALWAPGTKAYVGPRVSLPETTSYPRPAGRIPVIVGGNGEHRTLAIAARLGDGCNLPSRFEVLDRKLAVLRSHLDAIGRPYDDLEVTVLDLPVVGRDRDDVWARVEKLRGRTSAAAYAEKKHAGTVAQQRDRYAGLARRGVRTVFVSTPDLNGPDDVLALAGLTA